MNPQIDRLGPQTHSVVSFRSLNLQITHLGPQTCSIESPQSSNLVLSLMRVKTEHSKNFI
jgi:hypothetical protein